MSQVYLGIAVVLVALGHWAGVLRSAVEMVPAGVAVFVVCHLLFGLSMRSDFPLAGGGRIVSPTLVPQSVAVLLAILPRLFWPTAERVQLTAVIASLVILGVMWVRLIRRRRQIQALRNTKGHP
jgi:hypothetical protein